MQAIMGIALLARTLHRSIFGFRCWWFCFVWRRTSFSFAWPVDSLGLLTGNALLLLDLFLSYLCATKRNSHSYFSKRILPALWGCPWVERWSGFYVLENLGRWVLHRFLPFWALLLVASWKWLPIIAINLSSGMVLWGLFGSIGVRRVVGHISL